MPLGIIVKTYRYRALNSNGEILSGSLPARTQHHLRALLQEQQLSLIAARRSFPFPARVSGTKWTELQEFTHTLGTLVQANVPVLEALAVLRDGPLQKQLAQVTNQVRGGTSLAQAFGQVGSPFDPLFCGLLTAGEQSGQLSNVLFSLSNYYKSRRDMAAQLEKAYRYPLLLLVLWGLTFYVLMTFLVPNLGEFLGTVGQELSPITRSLLAISSGINSYGFPILTGIGLASIFLFLMPPCRRWGSRWITRIPLVRKAQTMRFLTSLLALLRGGVSLMPALELLEKTMPTLKPLSPHVGGGMTLSAATTHQGLLDPLSVRMIAVGERTGKLVESLNFACQHHQSSLDRSLNGLIQALEPVMLLILGGLLLWIVLGTIYPLYDAFSHIAF